jgi:hypothetical protein
MAFRKFATEPSVQDIFIAYEVQLVRFGNIPRDNWMCNDCGYWRDYYMVWDEIWTLSGLGPDDGQLCFNCLEKRVERKITEEDLVPWVPINTPILKVGLGLWGGFGRK